MVKSLNEYALSKKQNVKVQSFPRNTTEDMLDIVKPWSKGEAIIIHAGTNDITRNIYTMKFIRKIVKPIRDYLENTQVSLSGIINGEDGNHNDKISEIMASYSEGQGLIFKNNNTDCTCLN